EDVSAVDGVFVGGGVVGLDALDQLELAHHGRLRPVESAFRQSESGAAMKRAPAGIDYDWPSSPAAGSSAARSGSASSGSLSIAAASSSAASSTSSWSCSSTASSPCAVAAAAPSVPGGTISPDRP